MPRPSDRIIHDGSPSSGNDSDIVKQKLHHDRLRECWGELKSFMQPDTDYHMFDDSSSSLSIINIGESAYPVLGFPGKRFGIGRARRGK